MNLEELYEKTLNCWGEQAQYDQAVEECAELITALKHYRRGKKDAQAVIEELADVSLMLGQLTWMFGEEQVRQTIQKKLEKLEFLLSEQNGPLR